MADNEKIIIEVVPELQLAPIERKYLEFKDDLKKLKAAIREDLKFELGIVKPSAKDVNAIANQVIAEAKRLEKEEKASIARRSKLWDDAYTEDAKRTKAANNTHAKIIEDAYTEDIKRTKLAAKNYSKLWEDAYTEDTKRTKAAVSNRSKTWDDAYAEDAKRTKAATKTYSKIWDDAYAEDAKRTKAALARKEKIVEASRTKLNIGATGAKVAPSGDFSSLRDKKSYTTGTSSALDFTAQEKEYKRLDDAMKRVDATSKNTFPHKVSTTAQYMLAGAMIAGVTTGIYKMGEAIMESDKAFGMFQGVLGSTTAEATALQAAVFQVGMTYGGTTKDLNETILALGRAGVANSDLVDAMKAVSQIALLSGESLSLVTDVFVSWKTIYPEAKIDELADSMVAVSNATKAGIDDIKTAGNYMLTAGSQAGLTSDALLALAGSWIQIGKNSSTAGTESRRFFEQITSGKDDVKKAYKEMGINVDVLKVKLAEGGPAAEQAMKDMFTQISKVSGPEARKIIESVSAVLDKATIQSLMAMAKSGKDGLTLYEGILNEAGNKATGSAEKGAARVALTYEKMWERIKVSMTKGATEFEKAFKDSFAGAGATVGEFDAKMIELDETFTSIAKVAGTAFSGLVKVLGVLLDNIVPIVASFTTYKGILIAIKGLEMAHTYGLVAKGILEAASAQKKLNLFTAAYHILVETAKTNPKAALAVGTAMVVGGGLYALNAYNDGQKEVLKTAVAIGKEERKNLEEWKKTTNGQASGLGATYEKQLQAIEVLKKALSNKALPAESIKALNKSLEVATKNLDNIRNKATNLYKPTKGDPEGLNAGSPKLSDKDSKKATNDAEQRAKEQLRIQIALIKDKEAVLKASLTDENEIIKLHQKTLDDIYSVSNQKQYTQYASLQDDALKAHSEALNYQGDTLRKQNELNIAAQGNLLIADAKLETEKTISEEAKISAKFATDKAAAEAKYGKDKQTAGNEANALAQRDKDIEVAKQEQVTAGLLLEQKRRFELENSTLELNKQTQAFDAQLASAMAVSELQANRLAFEGQLAAKEQEASAIRLATTQEIEKQGLNKEDRSATEEAQYKALNNLMLARLGLIAQEVELSKELQEMKAGDDLINQAERLVDAIGDVGDGWTKASKAIFGMVKATKSLADFEVKQNKKKKKQDEEIAASSLSSSEIIAKMAKNKAVTDQENFQAEIQGYSQVAGAMQGFFEAGSAGAKVMQAAQAALAITSGVSAILAQGTDPLTGPARMAAMASIVGGLLGIAGIAFGGGGGVSIPALDPNAGTVLGGTIDEYGRNSEVSQSLDNIQSLFEDIHVEEYAQLISINRAVTSMAKGIEGAVTNLFRSGALDTSGVALSQSDSPYNFGGALADSAGGAAIGSALGMALLGPLGAVLGGMAGTVIGPLVEQIPIIGGDSRKAGELIGSVGGAMFGGAVHTDIPFSGLSLGAGTLGQKASGDTGAQAFATIREHTSGGWFSSSSENVYNQYSALDESSARAISLIYQSFDDTMTAINEGLGTSLQGTIDSYALAATDIDLAGLSGEDATQKLTDYFSAQSDRMANAIFGETLGIYQKLGEGMMETAVRVITEKEVALQQLGDIGFDTSNFQHYGAVFTTTLEQVGEEFRHTGWWGRELVPTMQEVTTSSMQMIDDTVAITQSLVDMAGGLDKFMEANRSYYDNYFTDAEKQANLLQHLTEVFEVMNISMPATTSEFRAMVESLDLTDEVGQKAYTSLMSVSGAFYDIQEATISLTEDIEAERLSLQETMDLLSGVTTERRIELLTINESNRALQESIWALEDATAAEEARKVALEKSNSNIKSFIDSMTSLEYKANELNRTLGRETVSTMEELLGVFVEMSTDVDGLTDAENNALLANKSLIDSFKQMETELLAMIKRYDDAIKKVSNIVTPSTKQLSDFSSSDLTTFTIDTFDSLFSDITSARDYGLKLLQDSVDSANNAISTLTDTYNINVSAVNAQIDTLQKEHDLRVKAIDDARNERLDVLNELEKYVDISARLRDILMPSTETMMQLTSQIQSATLETSMTLLDRLEAARDRQIDTVNKDNEILLDSLNIQVDTLSAIVDMNKSLESMSKSIRDNVFGGTLEAQSKSFNVIFESLKLAKESGSDTSSLLSEMSSAASTYVDTIKSSASTREEYMYQSALLANQIESLVDTTVSESTLTDVQNQIKDQTDVLKGALESIENEFKSSASIMQSVLQSGLSAAESSAGMAVDEVRFAIEQLNATADRQILELDKTLNENLNPLNAQLIALETGFNTQLTPLNDTSKLALEAQKAGQLALERQYSLLLAQLVTSLNEQKNQLITNSITDGTLFSTYLGSGSAIVGVITNMANASASQMAALNSAMVAIASRPVPAPVVNNIYQAAAQVAPSSTIASAYNTTLNRTPDAEGLDYWQGEIASGSLTTANVTTAIATAAIPELYRTMIGRPPTTADTAYWSGQIASGAITPEDIDDAIRNAARANGNLLTGFATGGYTGDMAANSVAGIVHGQEYVVNAQTTRDLGLNNSAGVFQELLNEVRVLKQLNVKLVADSGKILQTNRASLAYQEGA